MGRMTSHTLWKIKNVPNHHFAPLCALHCLRSRRQHIICRLLYAVCDRFVTGTTNPQVCQRKDTLANSISHRSTSSRLGTPGQSQTSVELAGHVTGRATVLRRLRNPCMAEGRPQNLSKPSGTLHKTDVLQGM